MPLLFAILVRRRCHTSRRRRFFITDASTARDISLPKGYSSNELTAGITNKPRTRTALIFHLDHNVLDAEFIT